MASLISKGWEYLRSVRQSRGKMAPRNGLNKVRSNTLGSVVEDSPFPRDVFELNDGRIVRKLTDLSVPSSAKRLREARRMIVSNPGWEDSRLARCCYSHRQGWD
jgi:hypothetical protein